MKVIKNKNNNIWLSTKGRGVEVVVSGKADDGDGIRLWVKLPEEVMQLVGGRAGLDIYGPGEYERGGIMVTGWRNKGKPVYVIQMGGLRTIVVSDINSVSEKVVSLVENGEVLVCGWQTKPGVENVKQLVRSWGVGWLVPMVADASGESEAEEILDAFDQETTGWQPSVEIELDQSGEKVDSLRVVLIK